MTGINRMGKYMETFYFNPSKCKVLHIGHENKNYKYTMQCTNKVL